MLCGANTPEFTPGIFTQQMSARVIFYAKA